MISWYLVVRALDSVFFAFKGCAFSTKLWNLPDYNMEFENFAFLSN
jgi:hypothetical protein